LRNYFAHFGAAHLPTGELHSVSLSNILTLPWTALFLIIWPRIRPSNGNSLWHAFNSGRYCLPEDGRWDRSNVQEPLSHLGGDPRTLWFGPSIDYHLQSPPVSYSILSPLKYREGQYICVITPLSARDKSLDYIRKYRSIGIGNSDHIETVVWFRGACIVKHDERFPIQYRKEQSSLSSSRCLVQRTTFSHADASRRRPSSVGWARKRGSGQIASWV